MRASTFNELDPRALYNVNAGEYKRLDKLPQDKTSIGFTLVILDSLTKPTNCSNAITHWFHRQINTPK